MPLRTRRGFTLLELVVAVTIVMTVMAFVLPKFGNVRESTYTDTVANDLRNLVQAQELRFAATSVYSTETDPEDDEELGFTASDKVLIQVTDLGDPYHWMATGHYISMPSAVCVVIMGRDAETMVPGYVGSKVECDDNF